MSGGQLSSFCQRHLSKELQALAALMHGLNTWEKMLEPGHQPEHVLTV